MKNILLGITTIIALSAPIAIPAQAGMEDNGMSKPKNCFAINKSKVLVNYNLTKQQKKTLSMIKANSLVIDQMKLAFSLENNIIACEKSGKTINGFTKKVNPTLVAYPSLTTYTGNYKLFYLVNGPESKLFKAEVKVGVSYSPKTGYTATAEINPIQ